MAIGAHPDDVELFAGGTVALLARNGHRVRLVHLTRGECSTRGTPETRAIESALAAEALGAVERITLDLGDGNIANNEMSRLAVVEVLRRHRPQIVLTHGPESRHPDHTRAHELVRDATFLANVGGYHPYSGRHHVEALAFWFGHESHVTPPPHWIVDISATHETKVAAIRAYSTQFYTPGASIEGPQTLLVSPDCWEGQEARWQHWGRMIGVRWGEAFWLREPPHVAHPFVRALAPAAHSEPSAINSLPNPAP